MVSCITTLSDCCFDVIVEPLSQGVCNLHGAYLGKKIEIIIQGRRNSSITEERDLSLKERITAVVVGVLLLVPIINTLVLTILRNIYSDHLYPSPRCDEEEVLNPISLAPTTREDMLAKKREALGYLEILEATYPSSSATPIGISAYFNLNPSILLFNLEKSLRKYQNYRSPTKLFAFLDWTTVPEPRKRQFRQVVNELNDRAGFLADAQYKMVQNLLSTLAEYFIQQRARTSGNGPDEREILKAQFDRVVRSILDANNNCIDQMLSQMQGLALDIIAEGTTTHSTQAKLLSRAGLALAQYRINLLKTILAQQNPNEGHMADLEREVIKRLAKRLGISGNIFTTGAYFYSFLANVDERTENALATFTLQYKPLHYLLTEFRTYHGNLQSLRNEIMIWANQNYALSAENDENLPDGSAPPNMDREISEDFEALPASEGGNLTMPAAVFLLEKAGLISRS